jgi:hypothetical protein
MTNQNRIVTHRYRVALITADQSGSAARLTVRSNCRPYHDDIALIAPGYTVNAFLGLLQRKSTFFPTFLPY